MAGKKNDTDERERCVIVARRTPKFIMVNVVGETALICNRMSEKARRMLVLGGRADRSEGPRQDPLAEYRDAAYRYRRTDTPTLIYMPAVAFKKMMAEAAVDIPRVVAKKVERLVYVVGEYVSIYGTPQMKMDVVRLNTISKPPAIRTRVALVQWAAQMRINFYSPPFNEQGIYNLFCEAAERIGVGDGRPGKGTFRFGTMRAVNATDADFRHIVEAQGRKVQEAALATPTFYDDEGETESLYAWYVDEVAKRRRAGTLNVPNDAPLVDATTGEEVVADVDGGKANGAKPRGRRPRSTVAS